MSKINVKIKFSPLFMWNVFGTAKVMVDNEFVEETKEITSLDFNDLQKHHVYLEFTKRPVVTNYIKIETKKSTELELLCGIKYLYLGYVFKLIILAALFLFYYFIIKINNRVITNQDYKIYYAIGLLIFVVFCLDSLLNYLIEKNPNKFIYFKEVINKKSK
ncbi:MAG: hypothetical protein K0Q49_1428 [Haloplasmataceae bacterium]|jgi:hypothetical protein|nr:hypothetical protein [Haloplasmataceae bacterium]